MTPKTLVATLVDLQTALENCERSGNTEWHARHKASLVALARLLPSGGGIDSGTEIVSVSASPERIKLACSFHHMNDNGMYDGWTTHMVRVTPSFNGITLTISGPDRNGIKDHLHEVFYTCLVSLVSWDSTTERWVQAEK